ncbi:hypothetical protein Vadar_013054 [Vaccinium darrowii]|uniref:Uncharacterized protein n=1 Tax=Vaccinium darrowii TaxID=229202 RepID=A0ACB7ZJM3_9ERIC|nr:hypothetical protein Vadar_013054 [Vaccinium darrowii]
MLAEEREMWNLYRVVANEFPGDGEIAGYHGFVITGSCSDEHGNDVWICKLLNFLKKLDSMKKKLLGICFGHQLTMADAHETDKNIEIWKIKKLIKALEAAMGNGASMISLINAST